MKQINKPIMSYTHTRIRNSKSQYERDNWTRLYFQAMKAEWDKMSLEEKYGYAK